MEDQRHQERRTETARSERHRAQISRDTESPGKIPQQCTWRTEAMRIDTAELAMAENKAPAETGMGSQRRSHKREEILSRNMRSKEPELGTELKSEEGSLHHLRGEQSKALWSQRR